jgi:signal peptidase II
MPFVGGEHFVFFSPVFNFADACISVSVVWLLLFYRQEISKMTFSKVIDKPKDQAEQEE